MTRKLNWTEIVGYEVTEPGPWQGTPLGEPERRGQGTPVGKPKRRMLTCECGAVLTQAKMAAHMHFYRWSLVASENTLDRKYEHLHRLLAKGKGSKRR